MHSGIERVPQSKSMGNRMVRVPKHTIFVFYMIQWRAYDALKWVGDFHSKESQNSRRHCCQSVQPTQSSQYSGPSNCIQASWYPRSVHRDLRHLSVIGTHNTWRMRQLYELVIKSYEGYCQRYGHISSQSTEDDWGGSLRGLGATTNLEIMMYQGYLLPLQLWYDLL
jgi:hypothetical protein